MRTLQRATAALIYPAILCFGGACERANTPTTSPPVRTQQELTAQSGTIVDWAQLINLPLLTNTVLALNDPPAAAEELPGLGQKFQLFFPMIEDNDPNNITNDVISNVTTATDVGVAFRNFPPGIKIAALDGQINLKYYFQGTRTCGGGSPRISLLVDADGDGRFDQTAGDFVAQGHVNPPSFIFCVPNQWHIEDLTDQLPRWETTPLVAMVPMSCGPIGGAGTCTWNQLETSVTTTFPNHKILGGFLVDGDACSFFAGACGKAFYDLLTLENRTLENRQDAVVKR